MNFFVIRQLRICCLFEVLNAIKFCQFRKLRPFRKNFIMSLHSQCMLKRKVKPLSFDITLNYDIAWADNSQLTIEFIKFLCVQKGQIPVPCPQLQKLSNLAQVDLDKDCKVLKTAKEKAADIKIKRKQMQFVKKAENFQKSLDDLCAGITHCFEAQSEQVAIILGTSIFNQKEVFILDWSQWPSKQSCKRTFSNDRKDFQKNLANFFRFLVTTENLFPILQAGRPSNLHVLCQTVSLAPTDCIPRLNFKPSTRVPQITLRILPPKSQISLDPFSNNYHDNVYDKYPVDDDCHRTVSRRLVFSSPAPANRVIYEKDSSFLDISGIGRLDDDGDKSSNGEVISENLTSRCWFQIQSSLTGFLETYVMSN